MAIIVDTLPYLLTQQKRVALPRNDTTSNRSKLGYITIQLPTSIMDATTSQTSSELRPFC